MAKRGWSSTAQRDRKREKTDGETVEGTAERGNEEKGKKQTGALRGRIRYQPGEGGRGTDITHRDGSNGREAYVPETFKYLHVGVWYASTMLVSMRGANRETRFMEKGAKSVIVPPVAQRPIHILPLRALF